MGRDTEKAKHDPARLPQVGDIVLIPVDDSYVPAKILYLSTLFRNVVLVGVYDVLLECVRMAQLPDRFGLPPIYTSAVNIRRGNWPIVGHQDLSDAELGLSERIVAGSVYLQDDLLREATDEDRRNLPKMLVAGFGAVDAQITSMLQGRGQRGKGGQ